MTSPVATVGKARWSGSKGGDDEMVFSSKRDRRLTSENMASKVDSSSASMTIGFFGKKGLEALKEHFKNSRFPRVRRSTTYRWCSCPQWNRRRLAEPLPVAGQQRLFFKLQLLKPGFLILATLTNAPWWPSAGGSGGSRATTGGVGGIVRVVERDAAEQANAAREEGGVWGGDVGCGRSNLRGLDYVPLFQEGDPSRLDPMVSRLPLPNI
ncbi:hypothetical protein NL676_024146 [Syzygium grande]|nr:hypothetical protein NL676_024146 [Syzygium grande]